jgi:hypothetical protein
MKNLVVKYGNKSQVRLEHSSELSPGIRTDSLTKEVTVVGVDQMFHWLVERIFGSQSTTEKLDVEIVEIKNHDS